MVRGLIDCVTAVHRKCDDLMNDLASDYCVGHVPINTKVELSPYPFVPLISNLYEDIAKILFWLRSTSASVELSSMTSHACQDAREKAGILRGNNHGYRYGATTTSRHVRFDGSEKEAFEDDNALIGWDDLCKFDSMPHLMDLLKEIDSYVLCSAMAARQ